MAASRKSAEEIRGRIRMHIPGRPGEEIVRAFDGLNDDLQVLITAHNELVTAVNAMATKLNNDAGVTDTDYADDTAEVDIDLD